MQVSTVAVSTTTEAVKQGYQIIPVVYRSKRPAIGRWTHFRWPEAVLDSEIKEQVEAWGKGEDQLNLGVILGEPSGNLIDIDLDHYRTSRLKDYFLPPTPAKSGRPGKPNSHYWYIAKEGTLPGSRKHLMPKEEMPDGSLRQGECIVEVRANGTQTVIPGSTWSNKAGDHFEPITWSGEPWGGDPGPALINGRVLAAQVALLALCTVLLDNWPQEGGRHDAYLALAGGLLRDGDSGVHPFWERNASVLIRALADATLDDDGPDSREQESIRTTIDGLNQGKPVTGFNKLSEILGVHVVKQVRLLVGEVESAAGVTSRQAGQASTSISITDLDDDAAARDDQVGSLPMENRDPLDERLGSWEPLDLEPYLTGQLQPVEPSVLKRDDGMALFYPGRVNMLYGSSESAKSWIALYTCMQEMSDGSRTMYLDFEDEPVNTLDRLKRMGAGADDLRFLFSYVRPEDPLASMQRDRWGNVMETEGGQKNRELFKKALESVDPSLIVLDGMTVLYGLHGLDSNDAVSTDIITGWAKSLTRNGKTTVIIIDHTGKGSERGSTPIGSQHKQAMVQGTMIQVWPIKQPMPDAEGEVELIVLKDRPGQVRKISVKSGGKAQLAAKVKIDSTVKDVTTMTITAPSLSVRAPADAAKMAAYAKEEEILLALWQDKVGNSLTMGTILLALGVERDSDGAWPKDDQQKWALTMKRLMDQGWIYKEGNTKGTRYTLAVASNDPGNIGIDLTNDGTDD